MFNERYQVLSTRREQLVRRGALQRLQLHARIAAVDRSLPWIDRAAKIWRFMRRHPLLTLLPMVAFAVIKPHALQRGSRAAFALWSMGRSIARISR
jgi:YqjK-like protein